LISINKHHYFKEMYKRAIVMNTYNGSFKNYFKVFKPRVDDPVNLTW